MTIYLEITDKYLDSKGVVDIGCLSSAKGNPLDWVLDTMGTFAVQHYNSRPTTPLRLSGNAGKWLEERGHDANIFYYANQRSQHVMISFEDPQLATLFKLTWL